jgi:hypothetical protein
MYTHRNFTACFAVLAALCGCSQSDPNTLSTDVAPTAHTGERSVVVAPAVPKTVPTAVAVEPAAAEPPPEESLAADYQPPFPDRVHLFLAPKRDGKSSTVSDQEEAVELLGFVNVRDHRKAVLSINGMVYPIAEGDSQFGVEVISIQPPGVVLQRGRQRWQASLEN